MGIIRRIKSNVARRRITDISEVYETQAYLKKKLQLARERGEARAKQSYSVNRATRTGLRPLSEVKQGFRTFMKPQSAAASTPIKRRRKSTRTVRRYVKARPKRRRVTRVVRRRPSTQLAKPKSMFDKFNEGV